MNMKINKNKYKELKVENLRLKNKYNDKKSFK